MARALNDSRRGTWPFSHSLGRLARSAWRALASALGCARGRGRHPRPASLAVFEVGELPELRQIFGSRAAHHTVATVRRALQRIDPVAGSVLRMTPTSFAVLLPGYDAESARVAVREALGEALAIESDWHGEELVVVPDFLIRTSFDVPQRVEQLHREMLGEIAQRQQRVQRYRDYLRRERESHFHTTRPAPVSAA